MDFPARRAPQPLSNESRAWIFPGRQRIAAPSVQRNRPYAHLYKAFRQTLSPLAILPAQARELQLLAALADRRHHQGNAHQAGNQHEGGDKLDDAVAIHGQFLIFDF